MKRLLVSLSAAVCCLLLSACCPLFSLLAQAQGLYVKAGLLGAGVGYAHNVNEHLALRTDFTTVGSLKHSRTIDQLRYDAHLTAHQAGFYGDWFPFNNGFRLSGGLHLRQLHADARVHPVENGYVAIGSVRVPYTTEDAITGKVDFPDVAPYLGIGWGHHTVEPGLGFVFDLGVSFGKPKTDLFVSKSLQAKLDAEARHGGGTAAAAIAAERRKLAIKADEAKIFPQIYVGLSYRF